MLYAMMHSSDDLPSTGSPTRAPRHDRNERLKQLVAFAGNIPTIKTTPAPSSFIFRASLG